MTGSVLTRVCDVLRRELVVTPARWQRMLLMSGCASLMATVVLVFRVPLAAYAAYLVLLVMQRDTATSLKTAAGALAAGVIAIAASFVFYMLDIDEPGLRLPLMACATFVAMYLANRPKLGPLTFLAGFLIVDTQTLIDQVPNAEALTHLLLWLLLVLSCACALGALAESLLGRRPQRVFDDGLLERQERLRQPPARHGPVIPVHDLALLAARLGAAATARLAQALRTEQAIALAGTFPPLADRSAGPVRSPESNSNGRTPEADRAANAARHPVGHGATPPAPSSVRFALKATLAAMTCYVLYSAVAWPGIHTAMITCFFVALGSTGETLHKLGLRLSGALAGGVLAGFAIVFLFPVMDDIGSFVVLLAGVTLFCTWVATSSPLLSYAGLQMAFAFYLGVLQDTGPTFDVTVLRDRLLGILLGNIAMSLVFSTLWPVSAAGNARRLSGLVLARQADVVAAGVPPAADELIKSAEDLETIGRLSALSVFDTGPARPEHRAMQARMPALSAVVNWSGMSYLLDLPFETRAWLAERIRHTASLYAGTLPPGTEEATHGAAPSDIPGALVAALDTLDEVPASHAP